MTAVVDGARSSKKLQSGNKRNALAGGGRVARFFIMAVATLLQQQSLALAGSAETYIAAHGGTLVPAGRIEIDGRRMVCGRAATVLDSHEPDFGAALPDLVILNPDRFAGLATPVKLWIFSHECAHLTDGDDEVKADCIAVQRGRREGWLSDAGLDQICEFMKPSTGDRSHFTGTRRCNLMQACFHQGSVKAGSKQLQTQVGR